MRTRSGSRTSLLVIALCLACGTRGSQGETDGKSAGQRLDRTVITRAQMLDGRYVSVHDAVSALRSTWLRPRGPDSFVRSSTVWVYVDGARLGSVETLRTMQPRLINTVRYYDGPTATSRWGVDHGSGVIHVSAWSNGAPGIPVPDSSRRKRPEPPPE